MSPPSPQLSIIIPCYNEARRIPQTLPRLAAFLETLTFPHEVLLVIEKSADNTLALALEIAAAHPKTHWRVIDNGIHKGKGYAVRSGVAHVASETDYICYMDADLSTDPAAIKDALMLINKHSEVSLIAGDRRDRASHVTHREGKSRIILSEIFNLSIRLLFPRRIKIKDTQCGFKMLRRAAAKEIFSRMRIDGFALDVELLLIASRLNYRVLTIPVQWHDAPHSTVRTLKHGAQMYWDLLRLRFRKWKTMV